MKIKIGIIHEDEEQFDYNLLQKIVKDYLQEQCDLKVVFSGISTKGPIKIDKDFSISKVELLVGLSDCKIIIIYSDIDNDDNKLKKIRSDINKYLAPYKDRIILLGIDPNIEELIFLEKSALLNWYSNNSLNDLPYIDQTNPKRRLEKIVNEKLMELINNSPYLKPKDLHSQIINKFDYNNVVHRSKSIKKFLQQLKSKSTLAS